MKNQNDNHILVKNIIKKKGWTEFEIYHSSIKNKYGGWVIETAFNETLDNHTIDGIFLVLH